MSLDELVEEARAEESEEPTTIEERFRFFDDGNPIVYHELRRLARVWVKGGHGKLGIRVLWERLRWELTVEVRTPEPVVLNNDFTALYARKLMAHEPELDGLFETRGRSSECRCTVCA